MPDLHDKTHTCFCTPELKGEGHFFDLTKIPPLEEHVSVMCRSHAPHVVPTESTSILIKVLKG